MLVDPVLAWGSEDVEGDGVLEGFDGVGDIGGDDEDFAGVDEANVVVGFAEDEAEGALNDEGDLLVMVGVGGDDAAQLEVEAAEHGL